MSLKDYERDAAFSAYCIAYCGTVFAWPLPEVEVGFATAIPVPIISAAIALGARDRMQELDEPRPLAELADAVEAMLGEEPGPAPILPSAPTADPTLAALEAYAEGRHDELGALEKWEAEERTRKYGDESHQALLNCLRAWIADRRASAPKRGRTARGVVERMEKWMGDNNDVRGLLEFVADLRRKIEGGSHG